MAGIYKDLNDLYAEVKRCTDCCHGDYLSYHCPFCPVLKYKPRQLCKVKSHLEKAHWNTRVEFRNGLNAVLCHSQHEDNLLRHYHCPTCQKIIKKKINMVSHAKKCQVEKEPLEIPVHVDRQPTGTVTYRTTGNKSTETNKETYGTACDVCGKRVSVRWLKAHKRLHKTRPKVDEKRHHHTVVINRSEGVFCSSVNLRGPSYPVHLIKKTATESPESFCENQNCIELKETAKRGGNMSYECSHLLSTPYATPAIVVNLSDDVLHQMRNEKFISQERFDTLYDFKQAVCQHPMVARIPPAEEGNDRYVHYSILTGTARYWSKTGRTIVTFDKIKNAFTCRCSPSRRYCDHKAIAKWCIFQEMPEVVSSMKLAADGDHEEELGNAEDGKCLEEDSVTNKTFEKLNHMAGLDYIISNRIPADISNLSKTRNIALPSDFELCPLETRCHLCNGNLKQELRSRNAKIVLLTEVIRNLTVYVKVCPRCRTEYSYREWEAGIHNFNNSTFLGLDVCNFLRANIQNHVALERSISVLQDVVQEKLIYTDIENAYLHFEALTNHEYDFNCVICGYHPTILIWDTFRKARFRYAASDVNQPCSGHTNETVDITEFWGEIEQNIILRGIDKEMAVEKSVKPNFERWGPWIGERSRNGKLVFNTEYRKCIPGVDGELQEPMPEEVIENLLHDEKITNIRQICQEAGVRKDGSCTDMILRLRQQSVSRSVFDKAYEKVFGSSGGWAVGCCTHGIVYAIKNLLRSESPRDYIDLERSLKHRPNISISDVAHLMAAHGNKTVPDFYSPYQGRLDEADEATLLAVEEGTKTYSIPCLDISVNVQGRTNPDINCPNLNPTSGLDIHLALYDWFHEKNCKKREEILRRSSLLKETCGFIDTQAVEQLFSSSKKDLYFINNYLPSNHLFMFRLILHLRNKKRNLTLYQKQKKEFGNTLSCNTFGQLSQSSQIQTSNTEEPDKQSTSDSRSNQTETVQPPTSFSDSRSMESATVQSPISFSDDRSKESATVSPPDSFSDSRSKESATVQPPDSFSDSRSKESATVAPPNSYSDSRSKKSATTLQPPTSFSENSPGADRVYVAEVANEFTEVDEISVMIDSLEYLGDHNDQRQKFVEFKTEALAAMRSIGCLNKTELSNFLKNLRYFNDVIFKTAPIQRQSQVVTHATTQGVFQSQGSSNYCGLCCLNNIIGMQDDDFVVTIDDVDRIADDLWLGMVRNPAMGITSPIEIMRDMEGFYSVEVLQAVFHTHGMEMIYLNGSSLAGLSNLDIGDSLFGQLQKDHGMAAIIVRLRRSQHWVAVRMLNGIIFFLDPHNTSPVVITSSEVGYYITQNINHPGAVFLLIPNGPTTHNYRQDRIDICTKDDASEVDENHVGTNSSREIGSEGTHFEQESALAKSYKLRENPKQKRRSNFIYEVPRKQKRKPIKASTWNDEIDDDPGFKDFSMEFDEFQMTGIKRYLTAIMECEDSKCDEVEHFRHHEFLKYNDNVLKRESKTYGFGAEVFTAKVAEAMYTFLEMVFIRRVKVPLRLNKVLLRHITDGRLQKMCEENPFMATHYIMYVLVKEGLIYLQMRKTGAPYEGAEEKCKRSEINMSDEIRKKKKTR